MLLRVQNSGRCQGRIFDQNYTWLNENSIRQKHGEIEGNR